MRFKRPRWWVATSIAALAGGLAGFGISFTQPPVFASTGEIRIEKGGAGYFLADHIQAAWMEVVSRRALANLIQTLDLYRPERERLPLEDVIDQMKTKDLKIDIPSRQTVRLTYLSPDPEAARKTSAYLLDRLAQGMNQQGDRISITQQPTLPALPESPIRWRFAAIGAGVGLLLACIGSIVAIRPVWSFKLASAGIAGAALIWGTSFVFAPDRFTSRAVLRIGEPVQSNQSALAIRKWQMFTEQDALDDAQFAEILQRKNIALYSGEIDNNATVNRLRQNLKLQTAKLREFADAHAATLTVSFTCPDAKVAQLVVSAVMAKLTDFAQIARREGRLPQTFETTLLDPATLPEEPDAPRRWLLALAGLIGGIVFGAIWFEPRDTVRRARKP